MKTMRLLSCASAIFLLSAAAIAQTPQERLLLPITTFEAPGAFGSLWSTELWMRNDTDQPVSIFPLNITDSFSAPHRDLLVPLQTSRQGGGQFIYVDRVDGLHFNLRVRDTTRAGVTFGTELPVVRDRDLLTEPLVLLPVPVDAAFRATLRIYDATFAGVVRARVRIFAIESTTLLSEQEVQLETREGLPFTPGYAQLALESILPTSSQGQVRIEIDPLSPGMKYWAFVSVTSNETQHVTTITPQ